MLESARLPAMHTFNKKALLPYLVLGFGILCLSFSALFVKWADAPGVVTGFYRLGLATLILLPFFARQTRAQPLSLRWGILIFPLLGGIFTALDHAVWNTSLQYTSAANATLLGNTASLWVALAAWLIFHEKLARLFWLGLAFALGGAAIVLGSDFLQQPSLGLGDLLALTAGFFYAGYFFATQFGRQYLHTLPYLWIVSLTAALVLLGISLLLRQPLTGYSPQTCLAFLGAALVSQVGGYFSVGYALGHLPATVIAPTMILQPVLTALLAIPLLGEQLHPAQWLGGCAVLVGIYLVHHSRLAGRER